ncbi:tRNA (5-methylaminomethyl-2-thiouridine)(34)-methyltransferase MnmD [Shewanella surugensis]|uniref:tRNA (5-methylaminomethyl-2-thiouridine)(34)-methyltransferase MnmD n=1 Tax=Shewanella surugensis TaxID=212020 RepID=A0ABT0LJ26_9GAMM|nr:tRNA (5-methylaminomethyl-2-thiouridine)(34)-methyltransferase MnmD [Shewanella surugensis]MCL1127712.1 tRNA (5-methylaminomethyl-2-thiouridine)(34)-methyltransferase MnmD [Shewanella surugensis]
MNEIKVQLTKDGSHTLMSSLFDDSYHAHNGAMSESQYVYIHAGFDALTTEFNQVNILELGFGSGMNAILSLQSALATTGKIERSIHYTSIEAYPLSLDIVSQLNYKQQLSTKLADLFDKLHMAPWNCDVEIMPGFILHKVHGKLQNFHSPKADFNLVYYDAFAPSKQPELWTQDNFDNIVKMMDKGGMLVSYCANGQFKRNLKAAGFTVKAYPGALGRREMTRAWKEI